MSEPRVIFTSSETKITLTERDGQQVLLKEPIKEFPSKKLIETYVRDFEINKKLSQEIADSIIKVLDMKNVSNKVVYTMEYDESVTLAAFKKKYNEEEFLPVAFDVAKIMGKIHECNVVHQDIKPQNILIHPKTQKVKYIDFGISEIVSLKTPFIPYSGNARGSFPYISPEQTGRIASHIDFRSDIYSLGCTFYHMLSGAPPFTDMDKLQLVHAHITKKFPQIPNLSPALWAIISKCCEKDPEKRYNSAFGLANDLQTCWEALKKDSKLPENFKPGQNDISNILKFSSKLYGRDKEIETVNTFIESSKLNETPNMLLIGGYSGCGKTALVVEASKQQKGAVTFVSGKYDQFQKGIPYGTLSQCLTQLVNVYMGESDSVLRSIKADLLKKLDGKGKLIADLCPAVLSIIGKQEDIPEASSITEAEERFKEAILGFFSVFASGERKLCIFLDDLQWADIASIQLLKHFLKLKGVSLTVIGAYRNNEIDNSHPLTLAIEKIENAKLPLKTLILKSLNEKDLFDFINDSLKKPDGVEALSKEIYSKTNGNAFFSREFILNLYSEGLIFFQGKRWAWKLNEIKEKEYSDNVADFMVKTLSKKNKNFQELLKIAACIGNTFTVEQLAFACEKNINEVNQLLWEPLKEGWLLESKGRCKFQHDRLQQAAYLLLEEESRKILHAKLGFKFFELSKKDNELENNLFEITNQFVLAGAKLIIESKSPLIGEILQIILNTADKAYSSTAFDPTLKYLLIAEELLPEDGWNINYQTTFRTNLLLAKTYYSLSDYDNARKYFEEILKKDLKTLDKMRVLNVYNEMLTAIPDFDKSWDVFMEFISVTKLFKGVPTSDPKEIIAFVQKKFNTCVEKLNKYPTVEDLVNLPECTDEEVELSMLFLNGAVPTFWLTPKAVGLLLLACGYITLEATLDYGICLYAPANISLAAWVTQFFFKNIKMGNTLGKAVQVTARKYGNKKYLGRLLLFQAQMAHYLPQNEWLGPKYAIEAWELLNYCADNNWGGFSSEHSTTFIFRSGKNFSSQLKHGKLVLEYNDKYKMRNTSDLTQCPMEVCRVLLKLKDKFDPTYYQENFESNVMARLHTRLYKGILAYYLMDYAKAIDLFLAALEYIQDVPGMNQFYMYWFWAGLTCVQSIRNVELGDKREKVDELLEKCLETLKELKGQNLHKWGCECDLLEAEKDALDKKPFKETVKKFTASISWARKTFNYHALALAYEGAGLYYYSQDFDENAVTLYLTMAYQAYKQMDNLRKTDYLREQFPSYINLSFNQSNNVSTVVDSTTSSTKTTETADLDAMTIIRATKAVSSEISLDKLIIQFMRIVMENAGAERGVILLQKRDGLYLSGECTTDFKNLLDKKLEDDTDKLSIKILKYTMRNKKATIVSNAAESGDYTNDKYIMDKKVISIFCCPIIHKGDNLGAIYLENNSIKGAFTKERINVTKHILSSVASSVDNAKLYLNVVETNKAYARFVPKEFLQLLGKNDIRDILKGDAVGRDLSVLFLDIRSFTSITEKMTPTESFDFVNQFLGYIAPVITKNNGFIDKFIGDAVMALFPGCVEDALRASSEMFDALEQYNIGRRKQNLMDVRIGVGVHVGPVILGTIGDDNRLDATVISDTVNTASRCESVTKLFGASILVTGEVIDQIKDQNSVPPYRCLGDFILKGKTVSRQLYEVMLTKPDVGSFNDALKIFQSNRIKESKRLFKKLSENDKVCKYFFKVASLYEKNPPPPKWKGEVMMEKGGDPIPFPNSSSVPKSSKSEENNGGEEIEIEGESKNEPLKWRKQITRDYKIVWDEDRKKYILKKSGPK